jgi:hypothetical protein
MRAATWTGGSRAGGSRASPSPRNPFLPTALASGSGRRATCAARCYSDQTVANREIRVWHFVIENGY